MTRSLASFVLTGSLAALGAGAVVFYAPQAQAMCIGGDGVCTSFYPTTVSTPTGVGPLGGGGSLNQSIVKAKIAFQVTGYTGSPFTLSNITFTGGQNANFLSFADATGVSNDPDPINNPSFYDSGFASLDSSISANTPVPFSTGTLSFSIPAGLNSGTSINAYVVYTASNPNNSVSSNAFTTSAVPGPLPLLGAGVAFSFSRTLRKRIKASNQV